MLDRSFVLLPGVGARGEARLWRRGIRDWDRYLEHAKSPRRENHEPVVRGAQRALAAGDGSFFAAHLPRAQMWRTWPRFGAGALSVDIETDDRGITVVGVHGRRPFAEATGPHDRVLGERVTRMLVRGVDLTPEAVTAALAPATMLLSFNGASFDMPALARFGVTLPDVPHADLLSPLRRAGLRGGLKNVERASGLARPAEVDGLTGYDAILLWRQHELGDRLALPRLLLYNACDVENLPLLAEIAYKRLSAPLLASPAEATLDGFTSELPVGRS